MIGRGITKRGLEPRWGGRTPTKVVSYRLMVELYRICGVFCRIIAGFYRLWIDFSRLFPRLPAFSRINFFGGQAGEGK